MPAESPRFMLSSNQLMHDRLLRFNRLAEAGGFLEEWASTMRTIFDRLETRPAEAGDPLLHLPRLKLTRYGILVNRICVFYALHDSERIVFVQDINPVLGHPLEGMA